MAELWLVQQYVRDTSGEPFVWGDNDCCLWACSWIEFVTGVDPAAELRGRYSSERQALALIESEGGILALCTRLAELAGLDETRDPISGDVGLLLLPNGPALGIRLGWRWAIRSHERVAVIAHQHELAWRVV